MMSRFIVIIICILAAGCRTTAAPSSAEKKSSLARAGQPAASPELLAMEISFDLETGRIKYTLPEPALVRIRIGVKNGGALLRNLLDWEYRAAGANEEIWDKKDLSGQVDFGPHKNLMLTLSCLPVDPLKRSSYKGTIKGFRKAPRAQISFPNHKADGNMPVLSGVAPVRVMLNPEDNRWLTETKYEMGLFIDSIFLAEDEEGINPYTYQLNTKGLNDGPHVITVNIVGYEGEVGTESVMVMVKNAK